MSNDSANGHVIEKNATAHPLRYDWLFALSTQLNKRCRCATDLELKAKDLSEATCLQEECIALLPEGHYKLAWYYGVLGSLRLRRSELIPSTEKHQRRVHYLSAIAAFEQAFHQENATTLAKLENGLCAGLCYYLIDEHESASKVLSQSIAMLQQVSPLCLDEKDRQKRLRNFGGMSTTACMCYLVLDDAGTAIEVLEAGRGIMANTAMKQHDQLASLKDASLELHREYIELRQLLLLPLPVERPRIQDLVSQRNENQAKLERLEDRIHQLPGLESLNKSLNASQIRQLADRGPLVVFCVDTERSFSIVITEESIVSLELSELLWSDIQANIPLVAGDERLSLQPPSKRTMAKKKMKALLGWLWDTAVKPVLAHLQILRDVEPLPLPRLWWVSGGLMGLMPLHAAGKGSKLPTENTYAHVISSYTSSFSALAFARDCQSKTSAESEPRVALVTMPQTAGRSDLATEDEAQAVRDAFSSVAGPETSKMLKELCQPTAEDVLYQVRSSQTDIFHLSCHAEPDLDDPSLTALLFGNDPNASAPEPLPIAQLRKYNSAADLSSRALQLAYLSACCTAQQYDLKLLDENIHLAAIFQLMGYPAVIGTFWEADDKAAAFIAKTFYKELFRLRQDEKTGMGTVAWQDHIVYALHEAVSACRATKFGRTKGADDVLLWANFVYFGA
jgi:CHAT domain-containing protein